MENWKPIAGYEGWYEVSDNGRVRSVDREIIQGSRYGHTISRKICGHILQGTDNGNGYLIVGLMKNQVRENHYVHRLVAEAFVENPKRLPVVNHLDYNKANNNASNLEWTTQIENVHHSRMNLCKPHNGSRLPVSGERYISLRRNRWRVNIQRIDIRFDRSYKTLEEAIAVREVIIDGREHLAG